MTRRGLKSDAPMTDLEKKADNRVRSHCSIPQQQSSWKGPEISEFEVDTESRHIRNSRFRDLQR